MESPSDLVCGDRHKITMMLCSSMFVWRSNHLGWHPQNLVYLNIEHSHYFLWDSMGYLILRDETEGFPSLAGPSSPPPTVDCYGDYLQEFLGTIRNHPACSCPTYQLIASNTLSAIRHKYEHVNVAGNHECNLLGGPLESNSWSRSWTLLTGT